jgi:hypothetical protein
MSRHHPSDAISRMDELWLAQEQEEQEWQATLSNDPYYQRWLDLIEKQRAELAGRRADALMEAGENPF